MLTVLCIVVAALAVPARAAESPALLYFDGENWVTASLDGDNRTKITHEGVGSDEGLVLSAARFSPDGTRIARPDEGGQRVIHTAVDGSDVQVVVENDANGHLIGGNNRNPFWSPDGQNIAYFTDRNHHWELWVTPAEGSSEGHVLAPVTADAASAFTDIVGEWSPSGNRITYSYAPANQLELGEIRILDTSGTTLTTFAGLWPSYSPDGSTIVYSNPTDGSIEFRNRNGGGRRRLNVFGAWVKWSADGEHLLATSMDGNIFTIRPDGSDIRTIVDDANVNIRADWTGSPSSPAPSPAVFCNGERATIVGTEGNDRLVGTVGRDVIVGLGGNDVIDGKAGNDVICGGDGRDSLHGGAGNDHLRGGTGRDLLRGQSGDDAMFGEGGRDKLRGGPGTDVLRGGGGPDRLFGGAGPDQIFGGKGSDLCEDGHAKQCE